MAVRLLRPGFVPYDAALHWQLDAAHAVRESNGDEALVLLQHPPVYTLGRRSRHEYLRVAAETLPAPLVETDRGGNVTFHGPGQLIGYPVLHLRRRGLGVRAYVWRLEEVIIHALQRFGLPSNRVEGRPGVWVGDGKIGAIGVRIEGGISRHGFSLNVDPDLAWYDAIVPCGLADASITSIAGELGTSPGIKKVEIAVAEAFEDVFGVELVESDGSYVGPREPSSLTDTVAHG